MTIPEIIAKYTRTGLVPQSYARRDEGGNAAFEPGFDPLDEFGDVVERAREAEQHAIPSDEAAQASPAPSEPEPPAPA